MSDAKRAIQDWWDGVRWDPPGEGRDVVGAVLLVVQAAAIAFTSESVSGLWALAPTLPLVWMTLRGRRWDHEIAKAFVLVTLLPAFVVSGLVSLVLPIEMLAGDLRYRHNYGIVLMAWAYVLVCGRQLSVRLRDEHEQWARPGRLLLVMYGLMAIALVKEIPSMVACDEWEAQLPGWLHTALC
ncbi:hypothetical protein [Dactylosporangium sp. CA-139066]|uniref:hypothetical protein n=1 Tax=Dactylosporangium sp. CA-139066 TaxID=3239930 RepID=UPI003D8B7476